MRLRRFDKLLVLAAAIIFSLASVNSAFAQGKGKGKDHGGGKNKAEKQMRGNDRVDKKSEKGRKAKNDGQQVWAQQQKRQVDRRSGGRDKADRDSQRQNVQREDRRYNARDRRVERQDDRRQDRRDDRRADRSRDRSPRVTVYDDRYNDLNDQRRGNDRVVPQIDPWPKNYGQVRSRQVHERKDLRKALKEQEKYIRRMQKNYGGGVIYRSTPYYDPYYTDYSRTERRQTSRRYSDPAYYGNSYPIYGATTYYGGSDRYGDSGHFDAGDILRSIIGAVFGMNAGYNDVDYVDPRYQSYGVPYSPTYVEQRYYDTVNTAPYSPVFGYGPANYNQGYYEPAAVIYPRNAYVGSGAGSQYVRRIFDQLLATGYEQGFADGITAAGMRQQQNATYYDPYVYQEDIYDPYSTSIGSNRRCLSQGYELGYEDARRDQRANNIYYDNGGLDLVSVLIGTASQFL